MLKRIGKILLVLLWIMVIFTFSSQDGSSSGELSKGILNIIENIFAVNFTNFILDMNIVIRKFAHFLEYAILGILICLNIKDYQKDKIKIIIYSLIFGIIVAGMDEFHQTFVIMRNGNVIDIFIDTLGCLLGILLMNIYKKKEIKNG